MIKLVLSDVDNTLIPLGAEAASERALEAVHALLDAGVAFGPATGRDIDGLRRLFRSDEACYATGLISNGKLVYLNGKLVRASYLDRAACERLCALAAPRDDSFVLARVNGQDCYLGATDALVAQAASLVGTGQPRVAALPLGDVVSCTLVCLGGPVENARLKAELARVCPELELLSPTPGCYDVVSRGWNKATALTSLCEAMAVRLDEVCVFGDSENDVPMLRAIPASVAVANAMPPAAEAARFHIGSCANDAVADALFEIAQAARTATAPRFLCH